MPFADTIMLLTVMMISHCIRSDLNAQTDHRAVEQYRKVAHQFQIQKILVECYKNTILTFGVVSRGHMYDKS